VRQIVSIAMLFLFCSCSQNYLYVQKHYINKDYLASSHVHTPDPRQEDPPVGESLIISWDFPYSLFKKNLSLDITVRFWDNEESILSYPVLYKRGVKDCFFPNKKDELARDVLTYKIVVTDEEGQEVSVWKHQLWADLIKFN